MRFLIGFIFFTCSSFLLAQNNIAAVDFIKIEAEITPIFDAKEVWGNATYKFETKTEVDSIYVDAFNMSFSYVSLNGKKIKYSNSDKQLAFKAPTKPGEHKLFLKYVAKPKQTVYFINGDAALDSKQIWTQGQGKYTNHWLPSFDDMSEKVELDLTIIVDEEYQVIANGKLTKRFTEDGLTDWHFDMQNPMSSYLAAFVIGDFDKRELKSASGIPIELYYEPKDSLKVEPTYRYTKEIFDFLEHEIGVPYPWQNYKQVPVQDFLYAGMENTSATVFSNQYLIDSIAFVDKNYVNVNAHELAHQWFGNLVTEVSSEHHWLHEGFATYYAYLTEKHLFGDEHFYWKLYNTAKTLKNVSDNEGGEALNNPKAGSLTFCEKGDWALVMLEDSVGDKAFKEAVKSYLQKHQFKNVTISDFLNEVEKYTNSSLEDFRAKWITSEIFPWEEVKEKLQQASPSLRLAFEIEDNFFENQSDDINFDAYWDKTTSTNLKTHIIHKYHRFLPNTLLNKAFLSNDIKLRQGLSNPSFTFSEGQLEDKALIHNFETLLKDKSYITIENALLKLWSTFPNNRAVYLEQTKNVVGMPNKNVRLLWLTLALVTPEYKPEAKASYYKELNGYTSEINHFETRQLAFQYLYEIQALNDASLVNLVKATQHHTWQFKKTSRNLLERLVKNEDIKKRIFNNSNSLNDKEKHTLNKLITQ